MAARKTVGKASNGHQLEQAMATLINSQALLVGQIARTDERFGRSEERFGRIDDRFSRIESELSEIKTILLHHQAMLEALPEAIREKIGFAKPR
jgi:chromosome segregation ATPase